MRLRVRLGRAGIAATLALTGALGVPANPAAAYCRAGFSPWADSTQTLHVWNNIPNAWDAAISASRHAWNNIHFDLVYYYPQYDSSTVGTFNLFKTDFSAAGMGSAPGLTYNNLSGQPHTSSDVWMNTDFTWNLTGVMNQNDWKADVRTVLTHEFGHSSGLAHPYSCDTAPWSDAEKTAVMWVRWVKDWTPNGDDISGINNAY